VLNPKPHTLNPQHQNPNPYSLCPELNTLNPNPKTKALYHEP